MDDIGATGFGESQRLLLGELKRRGEATITEIATGGLARETIRDHLKSLQSRGLVERAGVRREGRGRPEVVYRLTEEGDTLFPRRHGELLRELAEFLVTEGEGEVLERFFTARNRRKRERLLPRMRELGETERMAEMARVLTAEGFLAEIEEDEGGDRCLRLCHCPWRDLVDVSHLPCQAEMSLVSELLGHRLARKSFIPDGDSSCTYSLGGEAAEALPTDH